MTRPSPSPKLHRSLFVAIAFVVILSLVVLGFAVLTRDNEPEPLSDTSPPTAPSSASNSTTAALPDQLEAVSLEFEAPYTQPVLIELAVTATFTASTGQKRALYTIVGMSCGSLDGPTHTQSVNGTENLIHQNTRQTSQLLSYDVETPGKHRCNATVNAPSWDPEYGDARLSLNAAIRLVVRDAADFYYSSADSERPIVLDPGEKIAAVDETFPLDAGGSSDLGIRTGTHLTSCTITNGSRDRTKANLCTEPKLDREGSTIAIKTFVQQLDGDTVCRTVTAERTLDSIDHLVHHRLLDSKSRIAGFLLNPCGDHIRIIHEVANEGPAAVVVHRASTKAVAITN